MQEPQKQIKTAEWKNRLTLMKTLTKMQASANIFLGVDEILMSSQDKEKTAEKITQVLVSNKNEKAILNALKKIQEE